MLLLGIDLGSSSVKTSVVDGELNVLQQRFTREKK